MRVIHVTPSYKPAYIYGGPTMSVSMLCEQLTKAGHDLQVYTTTANGVKELDVTPNKLTTVDGVPVIYFKRITKDHTHFSPALLKALWKNVKGYDVVHIHAWWNLVSLFSCLIALLRGVPVVVSPRGTLSNYSHHNKNNLAKALIQYLLGKPMLNKCHLHVTSVLEYNAVSTMLKPKSIANLPNFVKLPAVSQEAIRAISSPFKLIFLSRIEEKKGLDILIKALPLLNFPYTLTIAGDGDENYINELKALTYKYKTGQNINWVGFQTDRKFKLLQEHDLLVLPSHDENFGNVIIESLGEGTAVLVSKFVGLVNYVIDNNMGWQCNTDEVSLSTTLNSIAIDGNKLNQIRLNAPSIIRVDFDEESLTEKYADMYTNIIANGRL